MCINVATTFFHTVNCAHFQHHNQVNWQSVYLIRQVRTWYDSLTAYQIASRRPSSFKQLLDGGSNRNRAFEVRREFILTQQFVTSSRLCMKSSSATFCYCMLLTGYCSKSKSAFGTQTQDPRPKTPDPRPQTLESMELLLLVTSPLSAKDRRTKEPTLCDGKTRLQMDPSSGHTLMTIITIINVPRSDIDQFTGRRGIIFSFANICLQSLCFDWVAHL